MKTIKLIALSFLGVVHTFSSYANPMTKISPEYACFNEKGQNYSEVLHCYRESQKNVPLSYTKLKIEKNKKVEKRSYELISQTWLTGLGVSPEMWTHRVEIVIPDNALPKRALLIINNGINNVYDKTQPKPPTDYSEETLQSIASKTRTITISVSNVPNQYLKYQGADTPKKEDDSVAYSWKLFLNSPETEVFSSLHIPMMEAVVKTMDLAEVELNDFNVDRFIVSGISKRAWTSWHTALTDTRVDAIVPFVIDILDTQKVLMHEYATFGKSWPIAFSAYVREGITEKINTPAFEKLMQIEDPLRYLNSVYRERLTIPKYIVNASGDSFFTPDNSQLYFDQLPGIKMLRMVPNSDHYGINQFTESVLTPFINRFQQAIPFPVMTTHYPVEGDDTILRVSFSEIPSEVVHWMATNSKSRDFRYSCDIRFVSTPVSKPNEISAGEIETEIISPSIGWSASFVEARFKDGLVLTTPVIIKHSADKYPSKSESGKNILCQTTP